jgi:hypothetical protein
LGFTNIFLSLILTFIVGVTLNMASLIKYKTCARQRRDAKNKNLTSSPIIRSFVGRLK